MDQCTNMLSQNDITSLLRHLQSNKQITVSSDSSLINKSMSTAIRITYNSNLLYAASAIVPGDTYDSFRPEVAGVFTILRLLATLPITESIKISHHLDNTFVIQFCEQRYFPPIPRNLEKTSADLRLEFIELAESLPVQLAFHHVKGHQDDHLSYDELSYLAKENIHCDTAARRSHPRDTTQSNHLQNRPSAMVIALRNRDCFIVDRYHQHLCDHEGKETLRKQLDLSTEELQDIDFDFLSKIMKTKIKKGFIQTRKFIWSHLPTYRRLALYI